LRIGYALVALAAMLFAANGPVSIVLIDGGVSTRYVVTGRLLGMVVVLLTWAVLRYPEHLRLSPRELLELAFFGIAGLALMQWTYAEAIARVDIGLVLMIEYMAPFLIALYTWVLWRHRQQRAVWVSAFVALAGLALVLDVGGDAFARLSGRGLLFSVTTCLIFSYYATHASKLLRERPPQVVLGLGGLFAVLFWSVTLAPIWHYPVDVVGGDVSLGGNLGGAVPGFLLVLTGAVVGTALPFALFLTGVSKVGPTKSAIVLMLESVAAIAISWAWLQQSLTPVQVAGGLVVVGAVVLLQVARSQQPVAQTL
jgi:drug/metabolite transporter (DMT)-like permease